MKKCNRCGERKKKSEFQKKGFRQGKQRYRGECKSCSKREPQLVPHMTPQEKKLYQFAYEESHTLEECCDRLSVPPRRLHALIAHLEAKGIEVKLSRVGVQFAPQVSIPESLHILPVEGEAFKVGILSDLHFGHKNCAYSALEAAQDWFHEEGVSQVLIPGDLLQGDDPKWNHECESVNVEDQLERCMDSLWHSLTFYFITGNHDQRYNKKVGLNTGAYIASKRNNLHFLGDNSARITIGEHDIQLWHPLGGTAATAAQSMIAHVNKDPCRPDILLAGHWHSFQTVHDRGTHMISCPSFQLGGGVYGNGLGGEPDVGALILEFRNGEFKLAHRMYRTPIEVAAAL